MRWCHHDCQPVLWDLKPFSRIYRVLNATEDCMRRSALVIILLAACVVAACAQPDVSAPEQVRRDRIVANLRLQFEQLRNSDIRIAQLDDSDLDGFDEGVVVIDGRNAMRFLVTDDDKHFFLVMADAVDVSRSSEQVAMEYERLRKEEVKVARARHEELLKMAAGKPSRGPVEAPITVFEFSDFQCPYCARAIGTVEQLLTKYAQDVRLVFMHMPLSMHPWAEPAAIAATCASRQSHDAFWSLHDFYFANQGSLSPENIVAKTRERLSATDIVLKTWDRCATDKSSVEYAEVLEEVRSTSEVGRAHGASGTPAFFVNGRFLSGAQPLSAFDEIIAAIRSEDE